MIDIRDFNACDARAENTLLLGGNERKAASCRALIEMWTRDFPNDPLIVLDHSGGLYETFAGESLLADLSSDGSVMVDLIAPFTRSETTGESSESIANALRQAVYQEIRSRDANDKFFDDLGKLVTDRMITYMLECAKCELRIASGERKSAEVMDEINLFSIFCRQHKFIETLMMKVVNGECGELPDARAIKAALSLGLEYGREHALSEYILDKELRFQKNEGRGAPVPFADLLYTTSETSNTQRCIKMQADASTSDFRALMTLVADKAKLFEELPTLKFDNYFAAPSGVPIFVCSSGSAAADRAHGAMICAAAGAAAQNAGRRAFVLAPEIERWGLVNLLDKFRQSWDGLSFIFGYGNFSRLSLDARAEDEQLIESLYSVSDRRIWHATKEERLNKAFDSYVSDADVIYRPDDLDCEMRAIEEEGRLYYASLSERTATFVRKRKKLGRARGGEVKLWITDGAAQREKLTLESLLEEGERL